MCLINELARYNKIPHQYRLTDESGPAHKKTFTVCLKLGGDMTEEYLASGPSIKKAQHAAAAVALEKTKFKHPPPKNRQTKNGKTLFICHTQNTCIRCIVVCNISGRSSPSFKFKRCKQHSFSTTFIPNLFEGAHLALMSNSGRRRNEEKLSRPPNSLVLPLQLKDKLQSLKWTKEFN